MSKYPFRTTMFIDTETYTTLNLISEHNRTSLAQAIRQAFMEGKNIFTNLGRYDQYQACDQKPRTYRKWNYPHHIQTRLPEGDGEWLIEMAQSLDKDRADIGRAALTLGANMIIRKQKATQNMT